jgi:hypothetical protein
MLKKLVILASFMKFVNIFGFYLKSKDFPKFYLILYQLTKSKNQFLVLKKGRGRYYSIEIFMKM